MGSPFQSMWGPQGPFPTGGPASPQTRTFPAPPNFHDYLYNTFGQEGVNNLPDNAYEAMQHKFFNENVLPWGAQTGQALEPLQEQFMQQTARDKAPFPRTELMAKQALASVTAPFKMFGGALAQPAIDAQNAADKAALEFAKQGGNPGIYQMAADMLGQAPYWMAGLGAAGAVTEGIAAKAGLEAAGALMLKRAITTAAGGLIQGSYDAAKAPEGSRWQEGMRGAALGAGMVGAIEYAGPMWRFLRGFGLSDEEAQAVEKVARNLATPAQEDLAAQAVMNTPQLEGKISDWVTQQIAGAKAAGVPKDAISEVPNGRFSVNLKTADGQIYNLGGDTGAKLEDFSKIIDRIYGHLNQGASIESIKGDPEAMTKFWNALEKLNSSTFNVDVPEGGANSDSNSPTQVMKNDTIKLLPAASEPAPELSFSERLRRLEEQTREEPTSSRKLLPDDVPPLERPANLSRPDQGLRNRVKDLYDAGLGIQDIADKVPGGVDYNTVLSWLGEAEPGPLNMATLSSGLRRMALEGEPTMTPEEISKGAEPFTPEALYSRGLVRGSIDVPLNKEGSDRAELVGRGLAGQFDRLVSDDLLRSQQTVAPFKKYNPQAEVDIPTPNWRSWARGEFEGGDPEIAAKFSDALVSDPNNWDIRHPGMSPQSTQPGESFNDFNGRVIPAFEQLKKEWLADKEIRGDDGPVYGIFTHFNPIRLIESYVKEGGTKNLGIDFEHYLGPEPEAGLMMHYNPVTNVMKPFDPLKYDGEGLEKGMLFTRHEDTDMNPAPPAMSKETPLYKRVMAAPGAGSSIEPGDTGATLYSKPGEKPTVAFNPQETLEKGIIHHEMIHAHTNNLDLHDWFREDDVRGGGRASPDAFVRDIYNGMLKGMGYSPRGSAEETFAYVSQAIRSQNDRMLDAFAAADTDRETMMKWYTSKANALMDATAELPDSLHKRTLERRINYTISQASGMLNDIRRPFAQTHNIDYDPDLGMWNTESLQTGEKNYFSDRNQALSYLEDLGVQEPLNSPELVDTSKLPEFPHFARRLEAPNIGKPPDHTDPPSPQFDPDKKVSMSIAAMSWPFRPFYRWADTIGTRLDRPDLPNAFYKIRDDMVEMANQMRPYVETMKDTIGNKKYNADGWARQQDFIKWQEAKTQDARDMVIREAGFSAEELSDLDQFEQHFKNLPGFMEWVQDTAPALRSGAMSVADRFPKSDTSMEAGLVRRGQLDPNSNDLRRVAATFLEGRMFRDYVKPSVDAAESLVNEKLDDEYTFGVLRPLLNRQLQFYRGKPDYTQQLVMDGITKLTQWYNKGVDKLNEGVLPDWWQMHHIEEGPRDVLQQFILFNYAGSLALRPMVPIRDSLQLFLTSFPILGEKYIWQGMRRAYNGVEDSLGRDAYETALQNGWLIERKDLPEMLGGGETKEEGLGAKVEGKVESWAKNALSVVSWAHNSNRMVAGWGHTLKIMDALEDYASGAIDKDQFTRNSDFWFLGNARRDSLVKEAGMLTRNPDQWESFAQRAARDLVDATQWNFSKGAAPGLYKYQIGRLFGQYGTYPMNYIEYGRNLVGSLAGPYRKEAAIALTRLGISHGAILSAMAAMGIDAGHWVFTQPMAYGGGPIFEAITNIPQSMDFESYKGAEARQKLIEPLFPGMLPGYDELHGLFSSISNKDDDAWTNILRFGGFMPMRPGEEERGYHRFVP